MSKVSISIPKCDYEPALKAMKDVKLEPSWDIVAAFKDLHQRLAMLDFCQNNIIVDYPNDLVQPDHVVVNDAR